MLIEAKKALEKAYAPYSKFFVGCCIKTNKGNLYSGCNIENASYGLTLCAESSAIAAMVQSGESQISEVLVIARNHEICTPCGACRQRIREFAAPEAFIHMFAIDGKHMVKALSDLLPFSFGPSNLEQK